MSIKKYLSRALIVRGILTHLQALSCAARVQKLNIVHRAMVYTYFHYNIKAMMCQQKNRRKRKLTAISFLNIATQKCDSFILAVL